MGLEIHCNKSPVASKPGDFLSQCTTHKLFKKVQVPQRVRMTAMCVSRCVLLNFLSPLSFLVSVPSLVLPE